MTKQNNILAMSNTNLRNEELQQINRLWMISENKTLMRFAYHSLSYFSRRKTDDIFHSFFFFFFFFFQKTGLFFL